MSVLACGRDECPSIMCDRLILNGTMYICEQCYKELLGYKETWPAEMLVREVRDYIEAFMNSPPGSQVTADVDVEFKALTGG